MINILNLYLQQVVEFKSQNSVNYTHGTVIPYYDNIKTPSHMKTYKNMMTFNLS